MAGSIGGGALAGLAGHYGSDSEDDADQTGKNSVHGNTRSSLLNSIHFHL